MVNHIGGEVKEALAGEATELVQVELVVVAWVPPSISKSRLDSSPCIITCTLMMTSRLKILTEKMQSADMRGASLALGHIYTRIFITTAIGALIYCTVPRHLEPCTTQRSFPQPRCHPETRTEMLKDLHNWALDRDAQNKILWLHGPAGAGKSAIMQTLSGQLGDAGRLGALELLHAIRIASSHSPLFLRFIVASRPEPYIHEVFESPVYSDVHRSFNVEQSFDDVRKYLSDEFARIHREHRTMANIPLPWPLPDILEKLVRKSSGHFIYASTIIKFIDYKNYRPTQQLAVVQDANSTSSQSAFDPLDQLYMTILSSAPRQSELIPILGAIVHLRASAEDIDAVFRLPEGETRLLLRSLHSVLDIPTDEKRISSHHASFLDFLHNPGRSRTFCVGNLQHRTDLARIILEAYVGPHEDRYTFLSRFLQYQLMPFIQSLPPSAEVAELLPLIGTIDPECIFAIFDNDVPRRMLAWLKKIPSASRDLIKLWEDYECMVSLKKTVQQGQYLSVAHIFPCSPEFLRILTSLVMFRYESLCKLRSLLDLTWAEMRTSICGPSSNVASDQHVPLVLAVRLAFRDVALQCIRKMVKNHLNMGGQVYSWETRDAALEFIRRTGRNHIGVNATHKHIIEQCELANGISYLVRLSPPYPGLYRELWCIPIDPTWLRGSSLIYHVSKWLEVGHGNMGQRFVDIGFLRQAFPDPPMELIAFWKQGCGFNHWPLNFNNAEIGWRYVVNSCNEAIVRLRLPDDLKVPLF
ncbi:hypothetical protein C8R45DRAFT_1174019 [Mycena sanguinolenta]|nr:hypothetical protein C8R45DRAFT_1174019 [Mycena sanguinolenta]